MAQNKKKSSHNPLQAIAKIQYRLATSVTRLSNYYVDGFNVAGLFGRRIQQNGLFKAVAQYSPYELAQRAFIVGTTIASIYAANQKESWTGLSGLPIKTAIAITAFTASHLVVMFETLHRRNTLHKKINTQQETCDKYALLYKNIENINDFIRLLESVKKYEPVLQRKGEMLVFLDKKRRLYEFILSEFDKKEPAAALKTVLASYTNCSGNIERLFDTVASLGVGTHAIGLTNSQ